MSRAGAVTVLRGSPSGIDTSQHIQYFHENSPGVPGASEKDDYFGGEVVLSDLNGDKKADLTVGATYEDGGNGGLITLRSDGSGLTATGSRYISPSDVGISTAGAPEFGSVSRGEDRPAREGGPRAAQAPIGVRGLSGHGPRVGVRRRATSLT